MMNFFIALSVNKDVDNSNGTVPNVLSKNDSLSSDNKEKIAFLQKPKVLIPLAFILLCLVGLSVGLTLLFFKNRNNDYKDIQETSTTLLSTTYTSTLASTSTEPKESTTVATTKLTTQPPTSTELSKDSFRIFMRSDWEALPMKGDDKLKIPVERVVIMDTQTDTCGDIDACKTFIKERQNSFNYLLLPGGYYSKDILENFLIAPDGSIFEGRGFAYEGQYSYDRASTSYNSQAIGVSFIGNYTESSLNEDQQKSFNFFIQKYIDDSQIQEDYQLYFLEQLVGPNVITKKLQEAVKSWNNWKEGSHINFFY